MKSTGIVRKIDELGRIVIPIELRRILGIDIKDPVEILVDEDMIILRKYVANSSCTFCGETKHVMSFQGKHICASCVEKVDIVAKASGFTPVGQA